MMGLILLTFCFRVCFLRAQAKKDNPDKSSDAKQEDLPDAPPHEPSKSTVKDQKPKDDKKTPTDLNDPHGIAEALREIINNKVQVDPEKPPQLATIVEFAIYFKSKSRHSKFYSLF